MGPFSLFFETMHRMPPSTWLWQLLVPTELRRWNESWRKHATTGQGLVGWWSCCVTSRQDTEIYWYIETDEHSLSWSDHHWVEMNLCCLYQKSDKYTTTPSVTTKYWTNKTIDIMPSVLYRIIADQFLHAYPYCDVVPKSKNKGGPFSRCGVGYVHRWHYIRDNRCSLYVWTAPDDVNCCSHFNFY